MSYLDLAYEAVRRGAVQMPEELAAVAGVLPPLERVLEIGSLMGGTLWFWRALAPEALIFSIDINHSHDPADKTPHSGLRAPGGVVCLEADSHDSETKDRIEWGLAGQSLDMVFVDGDHSYEGVRQDWLMYSSLLRPGGAMVFHDILQEADNGGPARLWRELPGPRFSVAVESDGGRGKHPDHPHNLWGMGVWFKPGAPRASRDW